MQQGVSTDYRCTTLIPNTGMKAEALQRLYECVLHTNYRQGDCGAEMQARQAEGKVIQAREAGLLFPYGRLSIAVCYEYQLYTTNKSNHGYISITPLRICQVVNSAYFLGDRGLSVGCLGLFLAKDRRKIKKFIHLKKQARPQHGIEVAMV